MPLLYFVEVMLRHPIVIFALALVVAILYGAGKPFGLPRLFWHEDPVHRFLAGVATTLLAAQGFLVAYLLDGGGLVGRRISFIHFLLVGAAAWSLLVGGRALVQAFRYSKTVTVQVPAGAFMAGMGIGGTVAFLFVSLTQLVEVPFLGLVEQWRPLPDPQLHLLALTSFVFLLATFLLLGRLATPAVGICVLLALLLGIYAAIEFWARNAGLGLLALFALLLWAGKLRYKLRIPALSSFYREPLPYPPSDRLNLLPYDAALDARGSGLASQRLILVCSSGGGIRAATWTAAILGQLDEIEGFRVATRLLTGSSGGMMGAASWLALVAKRNSEPADAAPPGTWRKLMQAVAMDSLTPLARHLVFHDIPLAFLSLNNANDRGRALEDAWCDNLKLKSALDIDLRISFGRLRSGEESGRWPSLVFSPMLIEDGRRLILSNLDLTKLTDHYVRWLSSRETGSTPVTGRASRTAYHLAQICPDRWAEFPVSTAARLSAAFPYLSPAVLLPTEARRRVVDAGYYDDYGLELACAWLRELFQNRQAWLQENISGILVIQIRDNVSELSVNPESEEQNKRIRERGTGTPLSRGLEGLTGPPQGLLAARESVMLFRNDSQLETLSHLYANAFGSEDFLTTTIFEFRGNASLSWHLALEEVQQLTAQVESKGIRLKLEAIESWLKQRDYWAGA